MQDRLSTPAVPDALDKTLIPKKKRRWLPFVMIALVLLLLSGIFGIVLYQNNVNQTNAHNAYLSSLSAGGTLVFSDSLSQESGSQWSAYSNIGTCQFTAGAYRIQSQGNFWMMCATKQGIYSNFAFEVQMTLYQGCSGIFFRYSGRDQLYYFHICANGTYDMARYDDDGASQELSYGSSSALHSGQGKPNTIAVRASGSLLTFYANEQQMSQIQDNSDGYTSGSIGLGANRDNFGNAGDVAYTNARLWTL